MKTTTSLVLALIGAIALLGGWYFGVQQQAPLQTVTPGRLAFPDLARRLPEAERVELIHGGKTLAIVRKDNAWLLPDHASYPVQPDKLHELLAGLTELRLAEPRTSDPAQYSRLGVEDPNDPASGATLLRVADGTGAPLAELIIGHAQTRREGPGTIFVRRPSEAQSWLAEGKLSAASDPMQWINPEVLNIDAPKIASATVTRDGKALSFVRKDGKFQLSEPPADTKLDEDKLEGVARALENVTLQDVRASGEQPGARQGESRFTTSDGMTITADISKDGEALWAHFSAQGEGSSKDAADALNAKLSPWTFQIGSWKEPALVPTLDGLKQTETTPPAASPATSPVPSPPPAQ
jgi:hypothetical protein